MRARIAQRATPRGVVAIECGVVGIGTGAAVFMLGATSWALALFAVCAVTMTPALAVIGRIEKSGRRE
jgi:hypothetical protein